MTLIIGISGKIGTGKSTVSFLLRQGGAVQAWRDFGDEVKQEVSQLFQFDLDLCYSEEGKDTTIIHPDLPGGAMPIRRILQWWGTDVRRAQDPMYWVKRLNEWLVANSPDSLVIGDVRFQSEAKFIRSFGGSLFRIHPYWGWKSKPEIARHVSETDLDAWADWDQELSPQYGLPYLEEVAQDIIHRVLPPSERPYELNLPEWGSLESLDQQEG